MTTLKIKVTKEILEISKYCGKDIDGDKNRIGANCAVALAVRDIFPHALVASTHIDTSYFQKLEGYRIFQKNINLPIEAQLFIIDFDRSSPYVRVKMPEIEFEVEIPDEVIEQINIEELRPLLINHPTLELV